MRFPSYTVHEALTFSTLAAGLMLLLIGLAGLLRLVFGESDNPADIASRKLLAALGRFLVASLCLPVVVPIFLGQRVYLAAARLARRRSSLKKGDVVMLRSGGSLLVVYDSCSKLIRTARWNPGLEESRDKYGILKRPGALDGLEIFGWSESSLFRKVRGPK